MVFEHVADLDELPTGSALQVELGGEPICVVRRDDGAVRAVHDTCSHQEYPLHEGFVEDNAIECGLHGSLFNLDTGKPESLPAVRPIPVYAVKVDGAAVYVDVDQQLNDASVPRH
jgi:3-phenylpropionate/trans-cinnamate dioxygenase ferredoxin component